MHCETDMELMYDPSELAEPGDDVCPVDWARRVVSEAGKINCGKNVMCRDGMMQLIVLIRDITTGKGQTGDLDLIRDICTVIKATPGCAIAKKAAECVMTSMEMYSAEWEAHCRRKRCMRMVCPSYYNLYIDPELCDGCGECIRSAPEGAVDGGPGLVSVIRDDATLKTAEFISVCSKGAIKKYSSVRPRIPTEPTLAGTACTTEQPSVRRRRRGPSSE